MQNFIQKVSRAAIKKPKIFWGIVTLFTFMLCVIPHYYFLHCIHQLKNKMAILAKTNEKNRFTNTPNGFIKTLQNASKKQKLLSNLFLCLTKSQMQWKRISEEKNRFILIGESPQFLQLKHFLWETKKHHLVVTIQKMEIKNTVHVELLVDKKDE